MNPHPQILDNRLGDDHQLSIDFHFNSIFVSRVQDQVKLFLAKILPPHYFRHADAKPKMAVPSGIENANMSYHLTY